jgi:hypothetical protein
MKIDPDHGEEGQVNGQGKAAQERSGSSLKRGKDKNRSGSL